MRAQQVRVRLRQTLDAHLRQLGYSGVLKNQTAPMPELVRINPVRGRLAYGETVSREDLQRERCHERLRLFSQRRTRQRSTILFFIGVPEEDQSDLEKLLFELDIRTGTRGGHVHVVPICDHSSAAEPRPSTARRARG